MPQQKPFEYQAITNLQRYLLQLSHNDERITPPPIDGIFGTQTRRSLTDFQSQSDLPVTGVADRETWDALFASYLASLDKNAQPLPVAIFPRRPLGYELSPGDSSFYVMALRFMLRELARDYGERLNIAVTDTDSEFDASTEAAVRHFQSLNRLPVTGRVGLATWNAITAAYNLRADEYA